MSAGGCGNENIFYFFNPPVLNSPYLQVFQPPPVLQPAQEPPVSLVCPTLQRVLRVPVDLALRWLSLEAQDFPRFLAPLDPLLILSLLGNHGNPDAQQEMEKGKQIYILNTVNTGVPEHFIIHQDSVHHLDTQ